MRIALTAALLCLTGTSGLRAASTTVWEMSTYQDFVKGRFEGISLARDGRLQLAPKLETLFASEQPAIWSVAQAADGTLYAGTGHRGRLYRINSAGTSSLLWTAEQPEIFAVTLDAKGAVYAATSPDGKIYRVENGTATEYFDPKSKYIWALAFGSDGALYVGTGDQGKIFRVTGAGQGEIYYETGQAQVTCLAFDRQGRLLAGSEPNGIIYQISGKDRAFVLYDSTLPEIRSIVAAPDGSLYAAALGGSIAKRTSGAAQGAAAGTGATAAPTTMTVTVTDANAQAGLEVKPTPDAPKPAPAPAATSTYSPVIDMTGVEKSALYKIHGDNTVETLWTSKEENVYDLLSNNGNLVFSTDAQGRVYRLSSDRKTTLLWQTNEGQATQLLEYRGTLLAATGEMGKLLVAGRGSEASGSYTSPVHDAGSVARWGRLNWRADAADGGKVEFRTRSGNSARPDRTWSEWSAPIADTTNSLIRSPNARYIQWRADFRGAASQEPAIESVTLAYLPQNTPPTVSSLNIVSQPSTSAVPKTTTPQPASTGVYSITVTDTGEEAASTESGTPTQNLSRSATDQIQVSWQAEDKDGDRLAYSLYFRGEEEREWKVLRMGVPETTLTLDSDAFADGRYLFRVVASDRPSNAGDTAREGEMVSAPVLIDNTPPVVTLGAPIRRGQQVEITVDAVDATSDLRRCEFSRNARPWSPAEAEDGVTDSRRERFTLRMDNVPAGEQLIVVRVYDAAGNAGLAKVVLR